MPPPLSPMQAVENALKNLLQSLPPTSSDKEVLEDLVRSTLANVQGHASPENRKTQWEYALKNEIFLLAASEGQALKDASTRYYDELSTRLDLVLSFTEQDACEQIFPFNVLYDLLETQTIASCSHVFSWIERRADRLTAGMVPQKGKALVLLRTLNDLLRRLSKTGSTTLFCGRILTFLSQVFPLGERSGVNLRGEYGPAWDGPGVKSADEDVKMEEEKPQPATGDDMQVDEEKKGDLKQEQKDAFYETFWSLQLPFSKPSVLTQQQTFATFKESVDKVLPIIKEATVKERAMMGSKTASGPGSLKRRREPEVELETAGQDYFFAKYLTSPELLDLEIADTHFRRQFLFQLLILLNHLLTFTKAAKETWSTTRNRSLQMEFTLDSADVPWVQETIQKTSEELRQTTPNGRVFAEAVSVILEREKNWTRWKNELCAPFDKAPWAQEVEVEVDGQLVKKRVGLEEATVEIRKRMRVNPPDWPHTHGSASLTEIWDLGYKDLADIQTPFHPGTVYDFVKRIKQEDQRIALRKTTLARQAERLAQSRPKAPAPVTPSPAPTLVPPTPAQDTRPASPAPPPRATSSTPAPLHPSLPAKPGTTPARPPPQESAPAPTSAPVSAPAPISAPVVPPPQTAPEPMLPPDPVITQYEENKQRLSWLALRVARDQYLHLFPKIGTGDVLALITEIENDKQKEAAAKEKPEGDKVDEKELDHASSPLRPSQSSQSILEDKDEPAHAPEQNVHNDAATKVSEDVEMKQDVEGDNRMEM